MLVRKKSGSASSASAASSYSSKGKRKLKVKDRKVSSQLAAKMEEDSDDEEADKLVKCSPQIVSENLIENSAHKQGFGLGDAKFRERHIHELFCLLENLFSIKASEIFDKLFKRHVLAFRTAASKGKPSVRGRLRERLERLERRRLERRRVRERGRLER